jgi:hypothetical protein
MGGRQSGQNSTRLLRQHQQRLTPILWRRAALDQPQRDETVDQASGAMGLEDQPFGHMTHGDRAPLSRADRQKSLMLLWVNPCAMALSSLKA